MSVRTVLVAHRERMVAEGLAAALGRIGGIMPVGVATTATELIDHGSAVDAVALDGAFPDAMALSSALRGGGVRVVLYGTPTLASDDDLRVSTQAPVEALAAALVPGSVYTRRPPGRLSPREREVLRLVAGGLAAKQVARQLGVTPKTIEHHKSRIYRKLGVPNQAAAINVAIAQGLV